MGEVDQFTFSGIQQPFRIATTVSTANKFHGTSLAVLAVARDHGNAVIPTDPDLRSLYEDGRSDCEAIQAG